VLAKHKKVDFYRYLSAVATISVCSYLQDLTAIGITKPSVRKKLKSEIGKLTIHDGIPDFKPVSVHISAFYVTLLATDTHYC